MTLLPADPRPARPEQAWPDSLGDLFRLTDAVGPEAANSRDDVIRAQILLGHAGDLDLDALGGPTGWPGGELTRGLKRYQRRKGLMIDGLMLPDGETIRALQGDLYDRLARYTAPTADEVDNHHDKLARHPADLKEWPRTALTMPGEEAPAYVQRAGMVASDADTADSPAFAPGAQVAQALPVINPAMTAPAAGGKSPPAIAPDQARAGRALESFVGDRINLLTLPVQIQSALTDGAPIKLPSMLLDPAIEQASKTPPSMPSAPEEPPPEGSKADEHEPTLEELIPPEMKPWVEGLEPFDQQLARELMLIYNRRGGPDTIKGNAIIVKEIMDALKKYPALADGMEHVGGSHSPDENGSPGDTAEGTYKKELHYLKPDVEGQKKGGSWADITFQAKPELAKELGIAYLHLSSAKLLKDGKTAISDEREKKARLEKNHPQSRVEIVEKPIAVRVDGRKIPHDWDSYHARIRDFAERLAEEIDAMRMQTKP
jgi:hypothetical protein